LRTDCCSGRVKITPSGSLIQVERIERESARERISADFVSP